MKSNRKDMADAKLISLVKDYEILYNVNITDYHNPLLRDNIWEEIGLKIGLKGRECKKRWSILRDLYMKSRKKRKLKAEGKMTTKPWKYESEMAFLYPFLGKKKYKNDVLLSANLRIQTSNQRRKTPSPASTEENRACSNVENLNPEQFSLPSSPPNSSSQLNSPSPSQSPFPSVASNSVHTFKIPQASGPATITHDALSISRRIQSREVLKKYFEAVAETIWEFSPALQVKVKSEISKIVHQAEMEYIQQSQFEPFLQTGQDLSQSIQFSPETAAHTQYSFDCSLTKQEHTE